MALSSFASGAALPANHVCNVASGSSLLNDSAEQHASKRKRKCKRSPREKSYSCDVWHITSRQDTSCNGACRSTTAGGAAVGSSCSQCRASETYSVMHRCMALAAHTLRVSTAFALAALHVAGLSCRRQHCRTSHSRCSTWSSKRSSPARLSWQSIRLLQLRPIAAAWQAQCLNLQRHSTRAHARRRNNCWPNTPRDLLGPKKGCRNSSCTMTTPDVGSCAGPAEIRDALGDGGIEGVPNITSCAGALCWAGFAFSC